MDWVPLAIGGWLLIAVVAAVVIGPAIRRAEHTAQQASAGFRDPSVAPRDRPPASGEVPAPRLPRTATHTADGTRSQGAPPVRDLLPASERPPTSPAAESR